MIIGSYTYMDMLYEELFIIIKETVNNHIC
jgi:hypothetical protein